MDTLRTIKFYGPLASRFGHVHRFAVGSMVEVSRALRIMIPGFEKFMMESKDNGLLFHILVDGEEVVRDQFGNPLGDAREIHIVPVVAGSKKAGIVQTIVGAIFIVAGAFVMGMEFTIGGGITNGQIGMYMIGMGISMVVGGVVQMLSPQPKIRQEEKKSDQSSYAFQGPVNVPAQGGTVPVLYGEMWTGSVVVSAGISVEDNYVVPSNPNPRSTGGVYSDGGSMRGNVVERTRNAYQ